MFSTRLKDKRFVAFLIESFRQGYNPYKWIEAGNSIDDLYAIIYH